MAYVDSLLKFSSSQVVSATAVSTNSVKLDTLNDAVNTADTSVRDIGAGEPLNIWIKAVGAGTAGDSGDSWTIALIGDRAANLASSAVVLQTLDSYTQAAGDWSATGVLKNYTISPLDMTDGDQYIGLSFTKVGTMENITITAGINATADQFKAYPKSANAVIVSSASSAA